MTPEEEVAALPRRTAHALSALVEAVHALGPRVMPLTAAEICLYDSEAINPRATGNALAHARRLGLVTFDGRYWWPNNTTYLLRPALEDRFLAETAGIDWRAPAPARRKEGE